MVVRLALMALCIVSRLSLGADQDRFVDLFDVKPADFKSVGRNAFFILEPHYQLVLEGKADGKPSRLVITVLDQTQTIDGVEARVVEEYETVDGKVVEISRNYYAIDQKTSDVYYFGEDVNEYRDGKIASHPGSWRSGISAAKFGLYMPAKPVNGQKFAQEVAPKVAMDRAEIVETDAHLSTPDADFSGCVKVKETSPLEPDSTEFKLYAPGVGQIVDEALKLVKHGFNVETLPAH